MLFHLECLQTVIDYLFEYSRYIARVEGALGVPLAYWNWTKVPYHKLIKIKHM